MQMSSEHVDLNGMPVNTQIPDSQTTKEASAKTHNPHDNKPLIYRMFSEAFPSERLSEDNSDLKLSFLQAEKREVSK